MTGDEKRDPDDAAVEWFVALRDEGATDEQRRAFAAWLAADSTHARAWAELERLWGALDAAPAQASPGAAADANVAYLSRAAMRRRLSEVGWRHAAAAAVLLLVVGIAWQLLPAGLWSDYRTGIGEHRIIALDDGSEVELGSASALDVDYSAAARKVRLVTGEAFFTVAKDAARPFVVAAEDGEVLVRGTAFNVKIGAQVAVAVAHNTVEVRAADRPAVRVTQGEGISYGPRSISAVAPIDLEDVQAWRQNQLVFHDARLADVIAELQRYRRGYVQLIGSDLADRRVTAVFDTRHPDAALESIARSLDLHLYRVTDLLIGIAAN